MAFSASPDELLGEAIKARSEGRYARSVELLRTLVAAKPALRHQLLLAETLAWEKSFAEAEDLYRKALSVAPDSRDAGVGLARVLLWQNRFREAATHFEDVLRRYDNDIDAAEGLGLAAYWSGDYRLAARQFERVLAADPGRSDSRKSLDEIRRASRSRYSVSSSWVEDDQPFSIFRNDATFQVFQNPLTVWKGKAVSFRLEDGESEIERGAQAIEAGVQVGLPSWRLTVTPTIGLIRYPDRSVRAAGSLMVQKPLPLGAVLLGGFERRELLATASAITTHAFVDRAHVGWVRDSQTSWAAGLNASGQRYFDGNRGSSFSGYVLVPVPVGRMNAGGRLKAWSGASFALADTRDSRFTPGSVSGERVSANSFVYRYDGSYDPYWTPHDLREGRVIALVRGSLATRLSWKFQGDVGIAKDRALAFGPESGSSPLPVSPFSFFFDRLYHPWRVETTLTFPISQRLEIGSSFQHSSTAFYEVNSFNASLVGRF